MQKFKIKSMHVSADCTHTLSRVMKLCHGLTVNNNDTLWNTNLPIDKLLPVFPSNGQMLYVRYITHTTDNVPRCHSRLHGC